MMREILDIKFGRRVQKFQLMRPSWCPCKAQGFYCEAIHDTNNDASMDLCRNIVINESRKYCVAITGETNEINR